MGTVGADSHWRVDPKSIKYLDEIAQGFQVRNGTRGRFCNTDRFVPQTRHSIDIQGSIWRAQWRSLTVIVKRLKVYN